MSSPFTRATITHIKTEHPVACVICQEFLEPGETIFVVPAYTVRKNDKNEILLFREDEMSLEGNRYMHLDCFMKKVLG